MPTTLARHTWQRPPRRRTVAASVATVTFAAGAQPALEAEHALALADIISLERNLLAQDLASKIRTAARSPDPATVGLTHEEERVLIDVLEATIMAGGQGRLQAAFVLLHLGLP